MMWLFIGVTDLSSTELNSKSSIMLMPMKKQSKSQKAPAVFPLSSTLFRRDARGITLVEVLIAMLIAALSITTIVWLEKNKWGGFANSQKTEDAIRLISKKVEEIRLDIIKDPDANWPPTAPATYESDGIKIETTIAPAYDNLGNQLDDVRKIDIIASWTTGIKTDTLEITTYVSKDF
ncbi:MAG: hypothetical protein GF398_07705 [Chitinivibrionales bacterium]|nr:hypothetical protein [Chitinivibrionales bacterium]